MLAYIIYIGQIHNCEHHHYFCELLGRQITNIIIYVYSVYDVLMSSKVLDHKVTQTEEKIKVMLLLYLRKHNLLIYVICETNKDYSEHHLHLVFIYIIYIGQINNCEHDLNFCELLGEQITNIIIYVYSVYDVLMSSNVLDHKVT